MIIKLYAIGPYSDIEVEFKKVELISCDNILEKLKSFTSGEVVTAVMDKYVMIEPASFGEMVDLRKRCSIKDRTYAFGSNVKKIDGVDLENKMLKVMQEDGETQLLKNEKLNELYEVIDKYRDLYKPKDTPKIWTKITKNVYFKSPWGEYIFAPIGSMMCLENIAAREFYVVTNTAYHSLFVEQGDKKKLDDQL